MTAGFLVPKRDGKKVNIEPVDLGATGISYVKSRLEKAGDLSVLVNTVFGNKGRSFTPLPNGTTMKRAQEFNAGGLMGMGASHPWMASHIKSLCGTRSCQLIFEDVWMQQKDMEKHPKPGMFFHNSKVYYLMSGENIVSALEAGEANCGFFINGFVISPTIKMQPMNNVVDNEFINQLANNTIEVFVSAYDQEGFVIWKK